jgi:hypothetical protein
VARNLHSGQNIDFQLRNLYSGEIVHLSNKLKIAWFNFLVDLKEQTTTHPQTGQVLHIVFSFLKPLEFWIWISSHLTQLHIYVSSISLASVFQQYSNCTIINGGIKMKRPKLLFCDT